MIVFVNTTGGWSWSCSEVSRPSRGWHVTVSESALRLFVPRNTPDGSDLSVCTPSEPAQIPGARCSGLLNTLRVLWGGAERVHENRVAAPCWEHAASGPLECRCVDRVTAFLRNSDEHFATPRAREGMADERRKLLPANWREYSDRRRTGSWSCPSVRGSQ